MLKFRFHIIAFLIASCFVIISFKSDFIRQFYIEKNQQDTLVPSDNRYGNYTNFNESLQVEADVRYCMRNPDGLLILGSSELTANDPARAIPYKFIPEKFGKQVIAIGHQGNQCLSILTQMAALEDELPHSDIMLIVSPGWFSDSYAYGTSLQSFLEFNNERTLMQVCSNDIPVEFKKYINDYVARKYTQIVSPSAILNHMHFSAQAFDKNGVMSFFWQPFYQLNLSALNIRNMNGIFEQQNKSINTILNRSQKYKQNFQNNAVNWDSLIDAAVKYHASISDNNNWGIDNKYYTQHVNGSRHHYRIPAVDNNVEYQDYKMLIDLFYHYKTNLTIVIQPLNPYAYDNLNELQVVVDSVVSYASDRNFKILNLFESDTSKYQKGLLTDVMHLGSAGWYKIDEFLMNQYWRDEK